ncbi:hypothetical protein [Planctobacterium marinum]|uniref:Uncharacterized protein n=1 Tax=Planctobacterium marinum TaxID=1631968 RepID=A0AA48HL74_9ALTE|nr:hypothetical protein MACH26_40020 [Planctobacterium marinum]
MKVLIFSGTNQYGVVSQFISGMKADLEALGAGVNTLDLSSNETATTSLQNIDINDEFDFIISFNGIGLDLTYEGANLMTMLNCPVYIFLVDHPIHLLQRFFGKKCTILCVDKVHVDFCLQCGLNAIHFPHAVSESELKKVNFLPLPQKAGTIAAVSHFDATVWREKLQAVWNTISDLVNASQNINEFMVRFGVMGHNGTPSRIGIDSNILNILRLADFYMRARNRQTALKKAVESHPEIEVYGRNVEKYTTISPSLKIRDAISFEELKIKCAAAKFVFHNVPGFSFALHDRLLLSIQTGTLMCTDYPDSILNVDPNFKILPYEKCSEVDDFLYDELRLENLEVAKQRHTWKARFMTSIL